MFPLGFLNAKHWGAQGIVFRVVHTVVFAVVAGGVAYRAQFLLGAHGGDQVALYSGAHTLWHGGNPYVHPIDSEHTVYYPLPALWLESAFAWMTAPLAALVFVVVSSGLLGFVLARDDWRYLPLILSMPFLVCAQFAQTSMLVLALALVPWLAGLSFIKPNLALALFAWRPSRWTILVAGVVALLSLLTWPTWPLDWMAQARRSPVHFAPWKIGVGGVGLVGALRWRHADGRLLLAMALVPQAPFFYDQLPLVLIARKRVEVMALAACSWMGWLGWMLAPNDGSVGAMRPWAIASTYVPCAGFVVWRFFRREVDEPC